MYFYRYFERFFTKTILPEILPKHPLRAKKELESLKIASAAVKYHMGKVAIKYPKHPQPKSADGGTSVGGSEFFFGFASRPGESETSYTPPPICVRNPKKFPNTFIATKICPVQPKFILCSYHYSLNTVKPP